LTTAEIAELDQLAYARSGQQWCDTTYMDLSGQNLIELPVALQKLSLLQTLMVGDNLLTTLPSWITTAFPNLSGFSARNNLLTSIPEEFDPRPIFANRPYGLTQIIDFANNQIVSLPNSWNNATF
jgi:Leucine-rich repeat (LRR) protein